MKCKICHMLRGIFYTISVDIVYALIYYFRLKVFKNNAPFSNIMIDLSCYISYYRIKDNDFKVVVINIKKIFFKVFCVLGLEHLCIKVKHAYSCKKR
ncbi:hypothetical protein C2G38_662647 [Gigaspora rosea]|uniref:Uncharacterized protein n=1 Tax=Gigaspora rosea TaxID=44941 RepID=A0A397VRU2_9GLOM|nr:hypothetical protein C2G38_662647 [Gigaspora rosea]